MQKNFPHERLEGERIYLHKHELSTAPEMFACIDSDRERLGRFLPWVDETRSLKNSENYVRGAILEWNEQTLFDFGIYRKGTNDYIGNIGAHKLDWQNERAEIGYWIVGAFEGEGFITEAVKLLAQELFRLGFFRIEIRCDARNEKSAGVPKRCGFQLEGVLRSDVIAMGARRDTMVWAKLRA